MARVRANDPTLRTEALERDGVTVPSAKHSGEASCATCRDTGWLSETHDPPQNGKYNRLVPCDCQAFNRADRLMSAIAGETARRQYTFASFRVDLNPPMKPAHEAAKGWASLDGPPWLVLQGGHGIGKTHLVLAGARVMAERGVSIVYYLAPDLMNALRATMRADSRETLSDVLDRVRGARCLILDDLGLENRTDWATEQLESILVHRAQHYLATAITTNVDGVRSPRIMSRMADQRLCKVIVCEGAKDVRLLLKGKA